MKHHHTFALLNAFSTARRDVSWAETEAREQTSQVARRANRILDHSGMDESISTLYIRGDAKRSRWFDLRERLRLTVAYSDLFPRAPVEPI